MVLKLYNSLSKKTEEFIPLNPPKVGLYTCGQTVYDYTHIGHGKKYVGDDLLKRTLTFLGYQVTHVQNVTDVGHLVSDADSGQDKMEKGALKAGKTVWEIAQFFTDDFYQSMDSLNIIRPNIISKATDHIADQIKLIQQLLDKGYAYDTPEAIYFEIAKFPSYASLTGQTQDQKITGVREEVEAGEHKKNPYDFALWFKCVGRFQNHVMRWPSPWGEGFPGWHIECSAMSMKYLGETIDIHTGGVDHLTVHHPNEIAQSEAATGKPFVRYWVHHEFLTIDGQKMSKSLGNTYRVQDVIDKGFDPMALRYFHLTAHYRSPQNFTWQALENAGHSLKELQNKISLWKEKAKTAIDQDKISKAQEQFKEIISQDINIPQALALVWEIAKSQNYSEAEKLFLITQSFDQVLGLKLGQVKENPVLSIETLPENIRQIVNQREAVRQNKDFNASDNLRKDLEKLGYLVTDTPQGPQIRKI
jgi:cysteinyl-tRNA synthetase